MQKAVAALMGSALLVGCTTSSFHNTDRGNTRFPDRDISRGFSLDRLLVQDPHAQYRSQVAIDVQTLHEALTQYLQGNQMQGGKNLDPQGEGQIIGSAKTLSAALAYIDQKTMQKMSYADLSIASILAKELKETLDQWSSNLPEGSLGNKAKSFETNTVTLLHSFGIQY